MSDEHASDTSGLPLTSRIRSRPRNLSNNVDFAAIQKELNLLTPDERFDTNVLQPRPRHHRSISDLIRPSRDSITSVPPPKSNAFIGRLISDTSAAQTFNLKFDKEMSDIHDEDFFEDEKVEALDDSSSEEIEIDATKIDDVQLKEAAAHTLTAEPDEIEPHTIFGSIREAVTASVRMAMDSRLAVRRNRHQMFRSLQREVPQAAETEQLSITDIAATLTSERNVFDQKNYRQCLQHPKLRPLGIVEVKRLWCALRFLIEEKNLEQFLKKYTPSSSLSGIPEGHSTHSHPPVHHGPSESSMRDVTLHYTHRFSSSGDVQLAPSLEGLMRQQTLVSRNRADTVSERRTLVNRHSLPDARRMSVKGLKGHDFRRASVAGIETSPSSESLGLNSEPFSTSISEDFRLRECERFHVIFDQFFKPELERGPLTPMISLPPVIGVLPYEKRLYKNLCAFLLACLSIEQGTNRSMMKLTQTALSYMRSIEECESSRVCKGFVNKVDNYLAILLFRIPGSENELGTGKSDSPLNKTFGRSKSNGLFSHTTEDFGATGSSATSDSLHVTTIQPHLAHNPGAPRPKTSSRLLGIQACIVTAGFVVLFCIWALLYPGSLTSAYNRYSSQLLDRVQSSLNVDRLVANLALIVPKEVIDDCTKNSRFDAVEPHLVVMASSSPTVGGSWIFLPDSGAFAAAVRQPSSSDVLFIERTSFGSPCRTYNSSSFGHRARSPFNSTISCPIFWSTNTSALNWPSATSIDGLSSSFGVSQVRVISSSKRPVIVGIHFARDYLNAVLDDALLGKPEDTIVLRDSISGQIISESKSFGAVGNQFNSAFRVVKSSEKFSFANTTAELTVAVSVPSPFSEIEYSTFVSLGVFLFIFIVLAGKWNLPFPIKDSTTKQFGVTQNVSQQRPFKFLKKRLLLMLFLVAVSLGIALLLLYISSDNSLRNVSDDIWLQLGETLQERFRLLPSIARLASSTAALQLTDSSLTSITTTTRAPAVTHDALTRLVQARTDVLFASSVGVLIKGALYGTHLPNISNPDPRTFVILALQRDVGYATSDWSRSPKSGMFGSIRRLMTGNDALPFGRSFNVTGLGRCVILVDFSKEILENYLKNYVAFGLDSIALRLFEYPSLESLATLPANDSARSSVSSNSFNDAITRTSVFDRDTLALNIPYIDPQASWFANAILSLHEVCGPIAEVSLTAWVVFIGVIIIFTFLIYGTMWSVERRQSAVWFVIKDSEAIIALAKEQPSKAALTHHSFSIRSTIITASGQSWRRKRNLRSGDIGDYDQPLDFDEIQKHVSERAVRHVRDALHNRNILTLCELESRENPLAVSLYKLISHNLSRTILLIVAIIHIGLQFFEPQTQSGLSQDGTEIGVLITEGLCILFEVTYILLHFGLKYNLLAMDNLLSEVENSFAVDVMTVIVLALTGLDWLLTMTLRFSFEYICPLRPWIFLLFFADLRRGLSLFVRAMLRAFDVILLWMTIIFLFALFGVLFFRTNLNADTNISSFGNIRDALITCFIFASTADNFSDLIYNASRQNPLFMLFFAVLWMIGMFCILAMVVGCFQHEFMHQQAQNVQQKTLITRTGMIAAFILIDVDQSGGISVEEFRDFISGCANHDAAATRRAFLKMFRNIDTNGDGQMDIYEFVMGIEDLSLNRLFLGRSHPAVDTKWKKWMRERVFRTETEWWRKFIEFLLLIELTAACTYGIAQDATTADWVCHGMMIFFTVEMLTKMLVYGPTEMLVHGRYDGSMFERRFDTVVVFGTFTAYYAIRFSNAPNDDEGVFPKGSEELLRIVQLIPVLRILSQVKMIRHVVTTFLRSAREFLNLFSLLLIIVDIYASIGVYLFAGLWNDPNNPDANFDTHSNAFLVLIECMVQQDWRNIMYNAVSTYGWSASLYFISFIFLISILFTNLFLGIILTQFSKIVQHKRETKAALQKPTLNMSQHFLLDG